MSRAAQRRSQNKVRNEMKAASEKDQLLFLQVLGSQFTRLMVQVSLTVIAR